MVTVATAGDTRSPLSISGATSVRLRSKVSLTSTSKSAAVPIRTTRHSDVFCGHRLRNGPSSKSAAVKETRGQLGLRLQVMHATEEGTQSQIFDHITIVHYTLLVVPVSDTSDDTGI